MAKSAKIRVLQVINSFTLGGAEKLVYELAERMDKTRFEVFVCSIGSRRDLLERNIRARLQGAGVTALSIEKPPQQRRLQAIFSLRKVIRQNKIDIVHTHCPSPDFYGQTAAFLAGGSTVVSTIHGSAGYSPISTRFLNLITNSYLAISQQVLRYAVQELKIPSTKLALVYNGIDLAGYSPDLSLGGRRLRPKASVQAQALLQELGIAPRKRVVTSIGRIIKHKGYCFLIATAANLLKKDPDLHFLLVGDDLVDPQSAQELRQLVKAHHLENKLTFAGVREDVPAILAISDVFVLPSLSEGFGLAAIEAMAAGVPVIATPVGVLPEIITHQENGWLISPGDSNSLTETLEKVLADPEQAELVGLRGQKTAVEKFGLSTMVNQYEKLYLRHVEQAAKRSFSYETTT